MNQPTSEPKIPQFNAVEQRFDFIKDEILRQNLATTMQYIAYLIGQYPLLIGTLKYSVTKDIIVLIGSIVEAVSHYWLQKLVNNGILKQETVLPSRREYKSFKPKPILIDNENQPVYVCHIQEIAMDLNGEMKFQDVLRALKRGNMIDEALFKELDRLRGWRNKIHLKGLTAGDIKRFRKTDLSNVFETSKKLITQVERSLVN
jgi:hypothetical protein